MDQDNKTTEYLGDGVYATWDGWYVWLDLRGQADPDGFLTKIGLEPAVLASFQEYLKKHCFVGDSK